MSSARSLKRSSRRSSARQRACALDRRWNKPRNLGPLISAQHREKVLSYYRLAREEGAEMVTGGGVPKFGNALDNGFYVQPTIYTGLPESARCVKEEIFGPVCHVAPFDTEEEAVSMANDTKYGLAASIWTTNLKRGHRVAQQMNVGITWVNCWFLRDLRTPFGGVGLSGIGREGGMHSLNFYSELNNICIRLVRLASGSADMGKVESKVIAGKGEAARQISARQACGRFSLCVRDERAPRRQLDCRRGSG